MNKLLGVIKSPYDVRDYRIEASADLPLRFECTPIVPIKNQGSKPTCVAHAAASLIEYHNFRQQDEYIQFSTDYIYGTRGPLQYMGDGMCIRDALANLKTFGDCYHEDCPTNSEVKEAMALVDARREDLNEKAYPHRISSYYLCLTPEQIKTALVKHGPVLISMNVYDGATIKNDVYTCDTSKDYGRHCVLVYGYTANGWLVQNSWGPFYAGDGRFTLPYDFKINEAWGITDNIDDPIIIKKNPNPFMNFIYKAYNRIVNFFMKLFKKD